MRKINYAFPDKIFIHIEGKADLELKKISKDLTARFKIPLVFTKINYKENTDKLAEQIALLKIRNLNKQSKAALLLQEIEFEKNILHDKANPSGAVYEGIRLAVLFAQILKICSLKDLHIVLSKRCLASFDVDGRYHLRSSVYSVPCIISTTGIIEAPAKPKEYYLTKQRLIAAGTWDNEYPQIKAQFKKQFIDYNDKRINKVVKGLILQALFYQITGNPFCENKNCLLYNAHWQKDLIHSQIESGKLCKKHEDLLTAIQESKKAKVKRQNHKVKVKT